MEHAQRTVISGELVQPYSTDSRDWFVVQVKPRIEKTVAVLLEHGGYEVFLPVYRSLSIRERATERRREQILFPGYVFGRLVSPPQA